VEAYCANKVSLNLSYTIGLPFLERREAMATAMATTTATAFKACLIRHGGIGKTPLARHRLWISRLLVSPLVKNYNYSNVNVKINI
jgi:hypothetical protein